VAIVVEAQEGQEIASRLIGLDMLAQGIRYRRKWKCGEYVVVFTRVAGTQMKKDWDCGRRLSGQE